MISKASLDYYHENGYLILNPGSDDTLWEAINCLSKNFDVSSENAYFKNARGLGRQQINVVRNDPKVFESITNSDTIKEIASTLIKSRFVQVQQSKLSYKIPGEITDWYPHQDNGYKCISDKREGMALFVCLEDMNEQNGALGVYPKSHLLGPLKHRRVVEDSKSLSSQMVVDPLPADLTLKTLSMRKGCVLAFHANTIHTSGPNLNHNSLRLALIFELEGREDLRLDDYGLPPILVKGKPSFPGFLLVQIKSLFSMRNIFWKIESLGFIKLLRRITHKVRVVNER